MILINLLKFSKIGWLIFTCLKSKDYRQSFGQMNFSFPGAQAIANLSVNANVAKAVAEDGGINILTNLARSMNRLVAEEAAGGLWNLSVGEEHKVVCFCSFCHIFHSLSHFLLLAITVK